MWHLDMRTLLFGFLICDLVCTIVMIALFLQNGKRFKGGGYWIVNFTLQTISMFLIGIRGSIPDWISILVANTFVMTGVLLGLLGLEKFLNVQRRNLFNYILVLVFILVHCWATFANPSLWIRNMNIGVVMFILCFQCYWLVFYRVNKESRKISFGVGLVFAAYCIVNLARIIQFLVLKTIPNDFFQSGLFERAIMNSYQFLFLLLTFSVILMVNNRLFSLRMAAEEELRKLNLELEARVIQRTIDLEEKTAELEAFCYSISHDLRAPLRAVNGFSNLFLKNYSQSVDEEGNNLIKVVIDSTLKMDNLINDLLALSKLGRKELNYTCVDMNTLIQSVINGLQGQEPERKIDIEKKDILKCNGDASMIYQVVINLLSNAIKYSSKKPDPKIEIGSLTSGKENIYFIKDNGVGFDQQYSHRLFNVFQRLHSDDDFKGTGIGLAIVKRIIHRLGGRVWAEGAVNEGATFYFSLPA